MCTGGGGLIRNKQSTYQVSSHIVDKEMYACRRGYELSEGGKDLSCLVLQVREGKHGNTASERVSG